MPPAKKHHSVWLLVVLMAISVATTLLGPSAAGKLRAMVHWAFAPLGDAGMYLTTNVKHLTQPSPRVEPARAEQIVEENEILRRKVRYLESSLQQAQQTLRGGRGVFSKFFHPSGVVPVRLVPARVVAGDSMPYGWTRVINVGRRRDAENGAFVTQRRVQTDRAEPLGENHPVLCTAGLVGRIVEAGPFTARVQLVTDAAFEIRGRIRRVIDPKHPRLIQAGDQMVQLSDANNAPIDVTAFGDGAAGLFVPEVRKVHNIRPGDVLQVRPDVGALPAPVLIGTVTDVSDDADHVGMVRLTVRPAVDLPSLREVYVVVPLAGKLTREGGR
ncbi:MAG: rod shape-determining protein MreC [Phycisphaerae bacterium]|nr:rod shape-determining protein MreC [Phycisphaerae bacterium]